VRIPPFAYRVGDGLLAGPYPGGWTDAESVGPLRELRDAGVTLFLDLTEAGELPPYHHLVGGARHLRLPIRDMAVPAADELCRTLDTIDAEITSGGVTYVHCWAGRGRTGTVVGCWLVRHGLGGEDALTRIVTLRRPLPDGRARSPETSAQRALVLSWAAGR
jgi:protein-tyrosine phosphatase